jgi:acyl-CoA dehydrogenase
MTIHDLKAAQASVASRRIEGSDGRPGSSDDLRARARRVAAIAAQHAEAVDREGRFPAEAIAAAKAERLMGVMIPAGFGGEDASVSQVIDVCFILGGGCASAAMIYAMHQIKVACVIRHGVGVEWHEAFLRRLCAEQLLVASSTTEGQGGGNVRASEAPIERDTSRIHLVRQASVISYGEEADAVVTTARRAADAEASDQVLAVFTKDDYTLEPTVGWDTLGMRGTRSAGFTLRASGRGAQILPEPYGVIHVQSMVPAAHLMWSGVWAGVAAGAVERARKHMRKAARAADGQMPPAAAYFTRAHASLRALRALIATMADRYEASAYDAAALSSLDFQTAINLLKVDASEMAVSTVMSALRACGLSGYRNDSDVSIGRHLRDILSSPIMINNDRILASLGASALMSATPTSVWD